MSSADRLDDHRLAARIAGDAGMMLVELREQMLAEGTSSWALEDAGDAEAHTLIFEALRAARPDDAILSEEMRDDQVRLEHSRVWIVDPVDGTNEFGQPPRADWAVHVALSIDGVAAVGAVALPAMGLVLSTAVPPILPPRRDGEPRRVVTSRWRPSAASQVVTTALDGEMVHMGSAGAKAMSVVLGHTDVYAHSGGQYEWDSCAPVAVAMAAGLHVSRIDGSPIVYNNKSVYLPDYLICRPEIADTCLDALGKAIRNSRYR